MAEKRRDSIADDWLEIESAASVLSLADDETLSRSSSPPLPPHPSTPPKIESSTETTETSIEKPAPSPRQPSEPSPTPRHETTENALSRAIEEAPLDNNTSFAANPIDYHKSCCTAITSLDDVATLAHDLAGARVSTLSLLQSTSRAILAQAKDLETMLAAYAKHWVAQGSNIGDMPLNPSVFDWISNLNGQLLRTQAELQCLKPTGGSLYSMPLDPADIPLRTNMTLATCLESLEDMQTTLVDFLPIFKADYDEFCTRWMIFPFKEPEKETQPPPRTPRRQPPHPAVCHIRSVLYDLKDRIQMIVVFLSQLCNAHPTRGLIDPTVTRSLVDLSEAITTILTNHGSEWIESNTASAPQGLISYPQFLQLDPDVLHDINTHLDNFKEELDIEKSERVASLYTPEMIHNHQVFLLLEGGQLNELRSVVEFLQTMLISNNAQAEGGWI